MLILCLWKISRTDFDFYKWTKGGLESEGSQFNLQTLPLINKWSTLHVFIFFTKSARYTPTNFRRFIVHENYSCSFVFVTFFFLPLLQYFDDKTRYAPPFFSTLEPVFDYDDFVIVIPIDRLTAWLFPWIRYKLHDWNR